MNSYTVINAIANCTTAFSSIGLLVHIFGDPDNSIWDDRIKAWLAKTGLTILTCGAIANVLTLSTPSITEVLLNCGMSITFFWLSWWQYEQFKEKIELAKKSKKRRKTKTNNANKATRSKTIQL